MMEDDVPQQPQVIIPPNPPPIGETAREASIGSAEGLEYVLDRGLLGKYAQQQTDINAAQAPQLAEQFLQNEKVYGPQLTQLAIDNLKQSDPTGFAIREQYGQQVQDNLGRKGGLSPEETRNLQQDFYASKQNQGTTKFGTGDFFDEARYLGGQRYNRSQQSLSDAASFLSGSTPQASFASLNQAGKTAPFQGQDTSQVAGSLIPSTNSLIGAQANRYGQIASNTFGVNNNVLGGANYQQQYTTNPFLVGVGAAAQVGGVAATAF